VCDNGRLIGVLGPRDLATPGNGRDPSARRTRLRDIVPRDLLYCLETTDLAEAAALMRESEVEWIPVVGSDRRPVGLLVLADLSDGVESAEATAPADRAREKG